MTYTEYLETPEWTALREQALERALNACQVCNASKGLEVHHRAYPKRWGSEPVSDLIVLCRRCHAAFHFGRLHNPRPQTVFEHKDKPAMVPVEILRNMKLSYAAKGLYSVICASENDYYEAECTKETERLLQELKDADYLSGENGFYEAVI